MENQRQLELHEIMVLRTSVQSGADVECVARALSGIQGIQTWSLDLGDWEKILRIEASGVPARLVVDSLRRQGIMCNVIARQ